MSTYQGKIIEEMKRSRSAITGVITKWSSQIQTILDKNKDDINDEDIGQLQARQVTPETKLEDCTTLNEAIWGQTGNTESEMEEEMIAAEEFHLKILTQINKVIRFLSYFDTSQAETSHSTATNSTPPSSLKMPKFNLPTFDGSYEKWTPFYEQFMASLDSHANLPNIQKFNYLKSALTGEASQLISHLPLSNSNYQIALNSLTDRYDNPRLIVRTHLRAIFQLKSLQKESASELRKLVVAFEENLMAIQALKVDTEPCGFVWVDILSEKLDPESRRQFELAYPGKTLQTLEQLTEFIYRRVQALEASEPKHSPKNSNYFKITRTQGNNNHLKDSNLFSQNYKASAEKCAACTENHRIFACEKFKSLSIQEKKNLVYSAKLCFNCLQSGHVTKDCKSKSSCRTCKGRHNSLLHMAKEAVSSNSTGSVVTGHSGAKFTIGLLPTAMVPIANTTSENNICRALLDSGSQLSFITEDAVQRLGLKRSSQSLTINGIGNVTKSYNSGSVKLDIQTEDRGIVNVIAYVLPKLTQFLPSSQFSLQNCFHIRSVKLADTDFNKPRKIEIILGSDVFEDLVLDGKFIDGNGLHFRKFLVG